MLHNIRPHLFSIPLGFLTACCLFPFAAFSHDGKAILIGLSFLFVSSISTLFTLYYLLRKLFHFSRHASYQQRKYAAYIFVIIIVLSSCLFVPILLYNIFPNIFADILPLCVGSITILFTLYHLLHKPFLSFWHAFYQQRKRAIYASFIAIFSCFLIAILFRFIFSNASVQAPPLKLVTSSPTPAVKYSAPPEVCTIRRPFPKVSSVYEQMAQETGGAVMAINPQELAKLPDVTSFPTRILNVKELVNGQTKKITLLSEPAYLTFYLSVSANAPMTLSVSTTNSTSIQGQWTELSSQCIFIGSTAANVGNLQLHLNGTGEVDIEMRVKSK
ncbi:MAG: hypothetical protein K0R63_1459 [Rickettsiales bacterium]|nr:hypothetical protein [Rickettsiales bacterium]